MSIISIFLATLIQHSLSNLNVQICDTEPCNWDLTSLNQNSILVCGCNVNCDIKLENEDQGKMIKVISYSGTTTLTCDAKNACCGSNILPNLGTLPVGIDSTTVTTSGLACSTKSVTVNCNKEASCKDMNITSNGVPVTVNAPVKDSFDEALFYCNSLSLGNKCKLNCADDKLSCEDAICEEPNCVCEGKRCPGWTISPTKSPTTKSPTVKPTTPKPTTKQPTTKEPTAPEVIVLPATRGCDSTNTVGTTCTIDDLASKEILVVGRKEGVKKLVVNCLNNGQCIDSVIVSGVNATEIMCGDAYQPCYGADIYIGDVPQTVLTTYGLQVSDFRGSGALAGAVLTCYGTDSCKNQNITIVGRYSTNPMVMAMGSSSFSDSCLDCDVTGPGCKLMCKNTTDQSCHESQCKGTCTEYHMAMRYVNQRKVNRHHRKHHRVQKRMNGVKVVQGSKGGLVILDKSNGACEIDCEAEDQCQKNTDNFRVYSGCNTTVINCGRSSCKEVELYVGALPASVVPVNTSVADFAGIKKKLILNCAKYDACQKLLGRIYGTFTEGVEIKAPMRKAATEIDIESSATVTMECDNIDGCHDAKVICPTPNTCVCNGGSCTDLNAASNFNTIITPAPTLQTASPTKKPTTNPTESTPAPTSATPSPTTSGLIVYTPGSDGGSFVCKNNVVKCILDCVSGSCGGQNILFISGANSTEVWCQEDDACIGAEIVFGNILSQTRLDNEGIPAITTEFANTNAKNVFVNCSAKAACKGASIKAIITLSNGFSLDTSDQEDAMVDAHINLAITGSCNLDCGSQGCDKLTASGLCDCDGDSCPTEYAPRQRGINYVPNSNNMNVESKNHHYPTFLPTAIIVCISFGLICLVAFCVYYKYFTNAQNDKSLLNNDGNYDTFNQKTMALEMNQI